MTTPLGDEVDPEVPFENLPDARPLVFAQQPHLFAGGFVHWFKDKAPIVFRSFPAGDVRGHESDDPDLKIAGFDHHVRRKRRLTVGLVDGVGGEEGKIGLVFGPAQDFKPEIEFVVSHRHGVVADAIHGRDGRTRFGPAHVGELFERRPLDGVAGIEDENGVVDLVANLSYEG